MTERRVLVVDDEPAMLDNCRRLLARAGYQCDTLAEPTRFRERIAQQQPDVVLMDLRMPGVDGMQLLTVTLSDDPDLPVIIMTAYATVSSAVQAIREGAFDYLTKPFKAHELLVTVERAVRHRELVAENRALRERLGADPDAVRMVGSSSAMEKLRSRITKVAASDVNVLITGESGTGKELIARNIHESSARKIHAFVPIDCASLPEGLLESELFGHERGAFTGAHTQKIGLFEQARGGTMFLDEVAELSPALQAKLLRVLEERQIRRVGGVHLIEVDVRVIAATNRSLEQAVSDGAFREDLFYRLNVVPIPVPPLHERRGDVPLLARTFLARFSAAKGSDAPRISPDVWDLLDRYEWPGNVRELKNLIERLVVLDEDGVISLADLPESMRPGMSLWSARRTYLGQPYEVARAEALRTFKGEYVRQLLDATGHNVSEAARRAGVNRRTLHRWLAELEEEGAPE